MKRMLSILLLTVLTVSLFGCSQVIVYPEEKAIHTWVQERTQGYTQVNPSSRMVLHQEEDGFLLKIDTGTDSKPRITVVNDKTYVSAVENTILTATMTNMVFAQSSHAYTVFDPYKNTYTPSMKVYQKDENTFRIFFWLYGAYTDYYPLPLLLTAEQYEAMLQIVGTFTEEQRIESENRGEDPVNYTEIFMSLYESKYFSDKASNPDGTIFYQRNGTSAEHQYTLRSLFSQLGLTEQNWRKSFESLGYTGQMLTLNIVYCDVFVGEDTVDFSLKASDTYRSDNLTAANITLQYAFCSSLSAYDFIRITQE